MLDEEKLRKLYEVNPFNQTLGGEILEIKEGYAKGRLEMDARYENIYGGMHGGCLFTLADSLCGIAAATYGHYVTTLNGNINYLRAAKNCREVICEAQVVRMGRTIGVIDYTICGDDGTLFATGTFHYYALQEELE
ncbi:MULTISPECIES: PaaI family thioesterase [Agathobacter]|uniref:Thioesterase n=1 Tax=Agathobacter ruminis TaxID=1712665 RepID=A0A2G3E125_9FIRM|nr:MULTISPECIES: PaaI family thioesterase [Agathobacter]MBQ1681107.1 PaaI family thioesterase [Agathobacter sp.]MDC7300451.1 PaaI family thioesterase [Agathobacter ruminis]PHU36939.1 thioesterase [Agathobacter ruminis]